MGNWFAAVAGAGSLQGLFMAAALMKRGKEGKREDFLLAGLMLVFSANIFFAGFSGGFISNPGFPESFQPFQPFFGPFVYLYVKSLTSKGFSPVFRARDFISHLLPAAVVALTSPLIFLLAPAGTARAAGIASWAATIGILVFYALLIGKRTHAFRDGLKREYSSIEAVDLGWLEAFMVAYLGMTIVDYALLAWMIHGNPLPYFDKILAVAGTVLVYGLGFKGLARRVGSPAMADPVSADIATAKKSLTGKPVGKYRRSGLNEAGLAALAAKVRSYMEERKPWLESEFSLQDLAQALASPRNQVSQAINEAFAANFYDFVNGYRIEEVKRLMDSPESSKLKMIALAFDSGFASKPTFNAAFKRKTGVTPSQYRLKKRGTSGSA